MTMAQSSREHNYPLEHLLGIPFEVRLNIYGIIVNRIHRAPRAWQRNPASEYDGLRLTCGQLHKEVSDHVFYNHITHRQASKIRSLPTNQAAFSNFRCLNIEVNFDSDQKFYYDLSVVLHRFQLSLQELRLYFYGQDLLGNAVRASGCAKRLAWGPRQDDSPLLEAGQDIEKKLIAFRQLVVLRNLRVLLIENANMQILPAMFMVNKPHLQAISIKSDPRSVMHGYESYRGRKHVLKGLLRPWDSNELPPVHALEMDANSVVQATDMVQSLAPYLRHLSWRVPNADYQSNRSCPQARFYPLTEEMLQTLSWRAPKLEVLRMCIEMRDHLPGAEQSRHDVTNIFSALYLHIPQFHKLKHLELHYSGSDEFGFLRRRLIEILPRGLNRLYISDATVSAHHLCKQLWARYFPESMSRGSDMDMPLHMAPFTKEEDDRQSNSTRCCSDIALTATRLSRIPVADAIYISEYALVTYATVSNNAPSAPNTNNCLLVRRHQPSREDDEAYSHHYGMSVGESRYRQDQIPLGSGKLGFVTFEYGTMDELQRMKLFRVNGRLLDREYNTHLANLQTDKYVYGIPPKPDPQSNGMVSKSSSECFQETETNSEHISIALGLHHFSDLAPKPHYVQARLEELKECEGLSGGGNDWYFGNEEAAQHVFEAEPSAKAKDLPRPSMVMEVEVKPPTRCQWMCPDAPVGPVGSFALPLIPPDWRE